MKLDYQISAGAVAIAFDAIPPENIRTALKAQGYRFNGQAWQKRGVAGSAELVRWIRAELDKHNASAPSSATPPAPVAAIAPPAPAPRPAPVAPAIAPPAAAPAEQPQAIAGLNSTFKARLRCPRESVAIDAARNMACAYGFSPLDGLYYVGEEAELARGPIVDIKRPGAAPSAPPAATVSQGTRRPAMAAIVGQAIAEQSPPLAPQAPPQETPRSAPLAAPRRPGKLRQISIFEQLASDLESYSRPAGVAPSNSPPTELDEMTARARELSAELGAIVYITRDLAADEWHLRAADAERGEHENLMRVVFPNGRYSD
jgi:hypothetical protein